MRMPSPVLNATAADRTGFSTQCWSCKVGSAYEATAREDHAACRNRRSAGDDAGGGTAGHHKPLGGRAETYLDAAPFAVAAHDFENAGTRPAIRGRPG